MVEGSRVCKVGIGSHTVFGLFTAEYPANENLLKAAFSDDAAKLVNIVIQEMRHKLFKQLGQCAKMGYHVLNKHN